jgi:hypothetical protein
MNSALAVQLEIELKGPEMGFAFWTNPIEGITVEQPFFRALPTINGDFLSLHHTFLLVRDGAMAAAAVLQVVSVLKEVFGKNPEVRKRLALRVRVGSKVSESAVEKLRELSCEIEFVREIGEAFEPALATPPRRAATDDDDGVSG